MCAIIMLVDGKSSVTLWGLIKERTTTICHLTAFTFVLSCCLLCFVLEQISYERTQMCVFMLTENHSAGHALIVLTQTNVLLLILYSLELRHSVSCDILWLMLCKTIAVSCVQPSPVQGTQDLIQTYWSWWKQSYWLQWTRLIQKGFGLCCQDKMWNNFCLLVFKLKLPWN